jgi:hypothetical protein
MYALPRYVHFAPHPAVPLYHPEMHFCTLAISPPTRGTSTVGNLPIFHVALGVERFPQQLDVQSDMLQHPPFCPPPSRETNPPPKRPVLPREDHFAVVPERSLFNPEVYFVPALVALLRAAGRPIGVASWSPRHHALRV